MPNGGRARASQSIYGSRLTRWFYRLSGMTPQNRGGSRPIADDHRHFSPITETDELVASTSARSSALAVCSRLTQEYVVAVLLCDCKSPWSCHRRRHWPAICSGVCASRSSRPSATSILSSGSNWRGDHRHAAASGRFQNFDRGCPCLSCSRTTATVACPVVRGDAVHGASNRDITFGSQSANTLSRGRLPTINSSTDDAGRIDECRAKRRRRVAAQRPRSGGSPSSSTNRIVNVCVPPPNARPAALSPYWEGRRQDIGKHSPQDQAA